MCKLNPILKRNSISSLFSSWVVKPPTCVHEYTFTYRKQRISINIVKANAFYCNILDGPRQVEPESGDKETRICEPQQQTLWISYQISPCTCMHTYIGTYVSCVICVGFHSESRHARACMHTYASCIMRMSFPENTHALLASCHLYGFCNQCPNTTFKIS